MLWLGQGIMPNTVRDSRGISFLKLSRNPVRAMLPSSFAFCSFYFPSYRQAQDRPWVLRVSVINEKIMNSLTKAKTKK